MLHDFSFIFGNDTPSSDKNQYESMKMFYKKLERLINSILSGQHPGCLQTREENDAALARDEGNLQPSETERGHSTRLDITGRDACR